MSPRRRPRGLWALALGAGLAALATSVLVSPAYAHGKEVTIKLTCGAPQASAPLERTCLATVVAANDGDPVTDARLTLTAARPGKSDDGVAPVGFAPEAREGQYVANLTLPAYGTWQFSVAIEKPAEGQVSLKQEILPPSGTDSPVGQVEIQLLRAFDLRDVTNVVFLGLHLVGTMVVLGANTAIFVLAMFIDGPGGMRIRRSAARLFPLLALASFALLAISGAYNAAYNSPSSSPGLYTPDRVASLPFGDAYLAVFALKMVLAVALLCGTGLLAIALRKTPSWFALPIAGGATVGQSRDIARLVEQRSRRSRAVNADNTTRINTIAFVAGANVLDGIAILAVVLVMDYLHLLSHAEALLGGS